MKDTNLFELFTEAFASVEKPSRMLDECLVLCPPVEDFGYESTPVNAVPFLWMGVDGVHCVILKLDGQVRDDSPILDVSPMDADDLCVLAPSLKEFLAVGCGVSTADIAKCFDEERMGRSVLVNFLSPRFQRRRLMGTARIQALTEKLGHLAVRKTRPA